MRSTVIIDNSKKQEFLNKHNFTELDLRNLIRYEEVRRSGIHNMKEWLIFMAQNNINGGSKLADWIKHNYKEFLDIII